MSDNESNQDMVKILNIIRDISNKLMTQQREIKTIQEQLDLIKLAQSSQQYQPQQQPQPHTNQYQSTCPSFQTDPMAGIFGDMKPSPTSLDEKPINPNFLKVNKPRGRVVR